MMLAAAARGPLAAFRFRAHAPLIDTEPAALCRTANRYWVRGPGNRLCMSAEAEY